MPVRRLIVGSLEANCYIAHAETSREALIVDAGGDAEDIADEIERCGLTPRVLFSTHGHVDHIEANRALKRRFPDMTLAAHAAERDVFGRPALNLSLFFGGSIHPPEPDRFLGEGDEIAVEGLSFRVIHVPGHTPGGAALFGTLDCDEYEGPGRTSARSVEPDHDRGAVGVVTSERRAVRTRGPVVFAGDTLFAGGIGRVDFPGGDEATLLRSIREKLFTLPDATRVLAGHGPETTIGEEKRSNVFVVGR